MELGKFWEASYKARMTVAERLEGIAAEELVNRLSAEERLEGLTLEQIEAYLQKFKQKSPKSY